MVICACKDIDIYILTRPEQVTQEHRITEANVGHQLLKKMGWEGAGLGAAEQGIQDPIKGGEVRSKGDKYKVSDDVIMISW